MINALVGKTLLSDSDDLGTGGRVLSVVTGSYLIVDAFTKKNKSFTEALIGGYLIYRGATGHCPLQQQVEKGAEALKSSRISVKSRMIIDRPKSEVYDYWRKLENLPNFMDHLNNVDELDDKRSHWEARIPGGLGDISWDAKITRDVPNKLIEWRSEPGSTIENSGRVRFADAGEDSTELRVTISYKPPGGVAGEKVAEFLNPAFKKMIRKDIERFREHIEEEENEMV